MLKLIKKYRNDPKRTVITFAIQKKVLINRLGDLMQKNEAKEEARLKEPCAHAVYNSAFQSDMEGEYTIEKKRDAEKIKNKTFDYKRMQVEHEQNQILEKDGSTYAFKENYHIKPLEYTTRGKDNPLKTEKDMRGGVVCEKSCKVLLCDLVLLAGVGATLFCLLGKLMMGLNDE